MPCKPVPARLRLRRASTHLISATLCALAGLSALPPLHAATPAAAPSHAARHTPSRTASRQLQQILQADWEWQMQDSPEWATLVGDHRFDDRLSDHSPAAADRRDAHARQLLASLQRIPRAALGDEDRISLDFALHSARLEVDAQAFPALCTRVMSAMEGPQLNLPSLLQDTPLRDEDDVRHLLTRLRAMPTQIDQDIGWLREGRKLGWVTFRASLAQVPSQIDGVLEGDVEASPLFSPFKRLPSTLPPATVAALQAEARTAIRDAVRPAFRRLRAVVTDELLPVAPQSGAMADYPQGREIYRLAIRQQTTLDLPARQIHQLGLDEVARIRGEMEALIRSTGFQGDFAAFVKYVTHDPKFFYADGDSLLRGYRELGKRVDPALPALFATLPRTPYGIRAIPAWQGRDTPEFYSASAADGSTPGWFNANVEAFANRPRWEMEALFLHEAVPGHHLQISRAQELTELPAFRRNGAVNAYAEGWALYAESLGGDLGLYTDPYSRFGRLRMEIWRAARLAIDTGIHELGWTRQQAIDWMIERTGVAPEDCTAEVDRYFVWPGQALGYKLGEQKILSLRRKAQAALGARFDLRRFHQALLDHGPLPLPILESVVDRWIADEQRRPATTDRS